MPYLNGHYVSYDEWKKKRKKNLESVDFGKLADQFLAQQNQQSQPSPGQRRMQRIESQDNMYHPRRHYPSGYDAGTPDQGPGLWGTVKKDAGAAWDWTTGLFDGGNDNQSNQPVSPQMLKLRKLHPNAYRNSDTLSGMLNQQLQKNQDNPLYVGDDVWDFVKRSASKLENIVTGGLSQQTDKAIWQDMQDNPNISPELKSKFKNNLVEPYTKADTTAEHAADLIGNILSYGVGGGLAGSAERTGAEALGKAVTKANRSNIGDYFRNVLGKEAKTRMPNLPKPRGNYSPDQLEQLAGRGAGALGLHFGNQAVQGFTNPNIENPNLGQTFGANFRAGEGDLMNTAGSFEKLMTGGKYGDALQQSGKNLSEKYATKHEPFSWKSLLNPEWYAAELGRNLPSTLAMLPAGIIAAEAGAAGGALMGLGAAGRRMMAVLAGAAGHGAVESAMEAANTYDQAKQQGMSEQEADQAARGTFWKNLALLGGSNALEAALALTPLRGIGRGISRGLKIGGRIAGGAATEGAQEMAQNAIQNSALGKETDWTSPQMLESGAVGALFGGGFEASAQLADATEKVDQIGRNAVNLLPDRLKQAYQDTVEGLKKQGVPEKQAVKQARDEVAQTPEGAQAIVEATKEAVRSADNEERATASSEPVQETITADQEGTPSATVPEATQAPQEQKPAPKKEQPKKESGFTVNTNFSQDDIQPGVKIKVKNMKEPLEVVDASDRSIIKAKNAKGTQLPVGRGTIEGIVEPSGNAGTLKPEQAPDQSTQPTQSEAPGQSKPKNSLHQFELPKDLQNAKPLYNYGDKQFTLDFARPIEKAAYIVGGKGKSKRHDDYVNAVESQTGMTESELRQEGQKVRGIIKQRAKGQRSGSVIRVPSIIKPQEGRETPHDTYRKMVDKLASSGTLKAKTKVKHLEAMKDYADKHGIEFSQRYQDLLNRFKSEVEAEKQTKTTPQSNTQEANKPETATGEQKKSWTESDILNMSDQELNDLLKPPSTKRKDGTPKSFGAQQGDFEDYHKHLRDIATTLGMFTTKESKADLMVKNIKEAVARQKAESPESKTPLDDFELPKELQNAKPRYSYGDKRFMLDFARPIEKAAYIVGGKNKSKRHDDYVKAVQDQLGMSEAFLKQQGQKIRDYVKNEAASKNSGGEIDVPAIIQVKQPEINKPQQNKPNQPETPNKFKKGDEVYHVYKGGGYVKARIVGTQDGNYVVKNQDKKGSITYVPFSLPDESLFKSEDAAKAKALENKQKFDQEYQENIMGVKQKPDTLVTPDERKAKLHKGDWVVDYVTKGHISSEIPEQIKADGEAPFELEENTYILLKDDPSLPDNIQWLPDTKQRVLLVNHILKERKIKGYIDAYIDKEQRKEAKTMLDEFLPGFGGQDDGRMYWVQPQHRNGNGEDIAVRIHFKYMQKENGKKITRFNTHFNTTMALKEYADNRDQIDEYLNDAKTVKPSKEEKQPSFKEGDRVTFTRNGKTLSGEIRSVDEKKARVNVDQVSAPGGVPIGRIEVVPLSRLRHEEEPAKEQANTEIETQAETDNDPQTGTAVTDRGTEIAFRYEAVDAGDLIASHDTDLRINPDYPQELQPRERSRAAYADQIRRISQNLDPERLGQNRLVSEGAPVVGPDMVVESGNGRTIALKKAYDEATPEAAKYDTWTIKNAEKFGLDPDVVRKMDHPIIVRVRTTKVNRPEFVKEANEQSVSSMAASEQAQADAEKISGKLMSILYPSDNGEINNRDNRDFIAGFMRDVVGPSEQNRYMTKEGYLNQEGVMRVRNAIFAKAYGDNTILETLAESTDNNVKRIMNAMIIAAPRMAVLREDIDRGTAHDLDISKEITQAVQKLSELRRNRETVDEYLKTKQETFFGDELSPIAKELLPIFDQWSTKKLTTFLLDYVKLAEDQGNPQQASMFEKQIPTREELVVAALKRVSGDNGTIQNTLFEEAHTTGGGESNTGASESQGQAASQKTREGDIRQTGGEPSQTEGGLNNGRSSSESVRQNGGEQLEGEPSGNVQRPEKAGQANGSASNRSGKGNNRHAGNHGQAEGKESAAEKRELSGKGSTSSSASQPGVGDGTRGTASSDSIGQRSHERSEAVHRVNFKITDELRDLGGEKTRFKQNVEALRVLNNIENEERNASPDEQAALVKYVGWGGLANAFDAKSKNWSKEYQELRALVDDGVITEDDYTAMRGSTLNAHFTSKPIIEGMYRGLRRLGFEKGRILEPAVGVGHFFGLLSGNMRKSSRVGVELDNITAKIAKQLYQTASIHHMGFEKYKIDDGHFDVAIGNVPFGNYKVVDPNYKGKLAFLKSKIHNYFFAKSLDKVRDGGIVMFITSSGSMNAKGNKQFRKYLGDRADFLGAIRLPSDAFKKNAGTEVTTDIIVLQKRPAGQAPNHAGDFIGTKEITVNQDGETHTVSQNEYFIEHPEMELGEHSVDQLTGKRLGLVSDGRNLVEALPEAIDLLPQDVYESRVEDINDPPQIVDDIALNPNDVEEGSFGLDGDKVVQKVNGELIPYVPNVKESVRESRLRRVRGMLPIRDAARQVIRLQKQDARDSEIKAAQKKLNDLYDAYVKKYNYLNYSQNMLAMKDDPLSQAFLSALEDFEGTNKNMKAEKEAIFHKRTINVTHNIQSVDTSEEALVVSLFETGGVNFDRMTQLTGKSRDALIQELDTRIYKDPETEQYVTADDYLSGNVRQKLRDAKKAVEQSDAYQSNVKALKDVQPTDLESHEIHIRLGAPWFPPGDMETFINELFDTQDKVRVRFIPEIGGWTIEEMEKFRNPLSQNVRNRDDYGVRDENGNGVSALQLIDDALNQKLTTITYKVDMPDGSEKTVVNQTLTNAARGKQRQIQQMFTDWWRNDSSERRDRLVRDYNERYNSVRLRDFDGSLVYGQNLPADPTKEDQASYEANPNRPIPGMTEKITLLPHQKDAVWRVLQGGNTMLAHEVGAGKTFEMITAAREGKRLGLFKKPLITVPKHLIDQWEADFQMLFPGSKVLKITNEGIPSVKPVKRKDQSEAEYEHKRAQNRAKRQAALNKIAVGDYDAILITHPTFERMPVSPELVQEHIQRQITDVEIAIESAAEEDGSNSRSVKQLETTKRNLEAKMRENIDEESKDVSIPFEELGIDQIFVDESHYFKKLAFHTKMHNVSGLDPSGSKRAEDMFLKTQWLTRVNNGRGVVFASGTPISNTIAEMYTVMRFMMMDELRAQNISHFDSWAALFGETVSSIEYTATGNFKNKTRFSQFHNVPELMTMFRGFADIKTKDMLNLPTPENEVKDTIVAPPSEGQLAYIQELAERAQDIQSGAVDKTEDNYLKITTDGRKAALDLRLVDEDAKEPYESKINQAVRNMAQIWKDTQKDRLTQLAFLDLGTPKSGSSSKKGEEADSSQDDSFSSVYDDIREKLKRKGIPANEIAFIHDAKTDAKRKQLFDDINKGKVRILIGSTSKMGEGMNVQEKLVALHHLDAPWRPSDLTQREGRILRRGNNNDTVYLYTYVTEQTFDAIMWDTIRRKAKFIAQVMNGTAKVRSMEDVDQLVMDYAQVAAVASGNPLLLEYNEVEQKLLEVQAEKTAFEGKKRRAKNELRQIPSRIESFKRAIHDYKEDLNRRQDTKGKKFKADIDGQTYTDREKAGKALINAYQSRSDTMSYGESHRIGNFAGFDLYATKGMMNQFELIGSRKYGFQLNEDSAKGTTSRMENAIRDIQDHIDFSEESIEDYQKQIKDNERIADQTFEREDELRELQDRKTEIIQKMEALDESASGQGNNESSGETNDSSNGDGETASLTEAIDNAPEPSDAKLEHIRKETVDKEPEDYLLGDDIYELAGTDGGTHLRLSPKTARKISDMVARAIDTIIVPNEVRKRKARGEYSYKTLTGTVKKKFMGQWRVVGHELGHAFEKLGFEGDPEELKKVAEELYPTEIKNNKTKKREGLAEFFQLWFVDPEEAQRLAPKLTEQFETFINSNSKLHSVFAKAQTLADKDVGGSAWNRVMNSSVKPGARRNEKIIGDEKIMNWYEDKVVSNIFNKQLSFEKISKALKKQDFNGVDIGKWSAIVGGAPEVARRQFEQRATNHLGRYIEDRSLMDVAEKAIKYLDKRIDKGFRISKFKKAGGFDLFDAIIKAGRVKERYSRRDEEGKRKFTVLPFTEADADQVLSEAKEKFPKAYDLAREYTRMLSNINLTKEEDAGKLSPETRKAVEAGSAWYIPLVSAEVGGDYAGGEGEGGRTAKNSVKHFREQSGPTLDFLSATMYKLMETEQSIQVKRTLDYMEEAIRQDEMGKFGRIIPQRNLPKTFQGIQIVDQLKKAYGETMLDEEQVMDQAFKIFLPQGLEGIKPGETIVMNWHGNKPVFMRLNTQVFEGFMAMRSVKLKEAARIGAKIGSFQRYFFLLSPHYYANALSRDLFGAGVQREGGRNPLGLITGSIYGMDVAIRGEYKKSYKKVIDSYVQSGAFMSGLENAMQSLRRGHITDDLLPMEAPGMFRAGKKTFVKLAEGPGHILRVLEEMQRYPEYVKVIKKEVKKANKGIKNKDHRLDYRVLLDGDREIPVRWENDVERILVEAAYAASEVTTNFNRIGKSEFIQQWGSTVPFMRGTLSGLYRASRQVKQHPVKTTSRIMMYLIPLTLLAWWWNKDNREGDLSSSLRDRYWFIPFGDEKNPRFFYGIAKPYEYAFIANMLERYLDWKYSNEPDARKPMEDIGELLSQTFGVPTIQPMASTIIHLWAGKNNFGGDLIPEGEKGLPPEMQYDPVRTSELARMMSRMMGELTDNQTLRFSPRAFDYFIHGAFGSLGELVTMGADALIKDKGGPGVLEKMKKLPPYEKPLVGSLFYGSTEGGSRIVDKFYKKYGRSQNLSASTDNMLKLVARKAYPKYGKKELDDLGEYIGGLNSHEEIRNLAQEWVANRKGKGTLPVRPISPDEVKTLMANSVMRKYSKILSGMRDNLQEVLRSDKETLPVKQTAKLRMDYYEKLTAGYLFGYKPAIPPNSGITERDTEQYLAMLQAKGTKAYNDEVDRKGGPTQHAKVLEFLMYVQQLNKKK